MDLFHYERVSLSGDILKIIISIILVIGIINSKMAWRITEGWKYIVDTDFSPTILLRNEEYYKFECLYDRLSIITFDARMTPFKYSSIETMTSNLGIQNIEQPGDIINEMNRITKGQLMCIMQFINKNDKVHMHLLNKYRF